MVVVSYDISNDKLRTKFAKYLSRFGHRLQYSVFEIDNSPRIIDNIITDIKNKFEKKHADMIVANNLKVAGAGFGTDTNVVTLITKEGEKELPIQTKDEVSYEILNEIMNKMA